MMIRIKFIKDEFDIEDDMVFNVDETPIYIKSKANYTLDLKGKRGPTVSTSFNKEKERVTFFLTINSDGTHLKPMIVVKGKKLKG